MNPSTRHNNFTTLLVPDKDAAYDESLHHDILDSVIMPLLQASDEAYVYGIRKDDDLFKIGYDFLVPHRGKCKIVVERAHTNGSERLWNSHGGKRGTIVISTPINRIDQELIFSQTSRVWIFSNYRAGHTPAAVNFARKTIESKKNLVFCLPRNNGIEWMEVFGPTALIDSVYENAQISCRGI